MKTTLLMILILYGTQCFSQQSKYYKSDKNRILSEQAYADLKDTIVSTFKKMKQNVKIQENFGKVERNGDSIIQNYTFDLLPILENGEIGTVDKPKFGQQLIGKRLPTTTLKKLDGTELNLNNLIGKPTMINFWFTSCKPCIDEFPVLNSIRKKYTNEVNFISITFDEKDKVERLIKKFDFQFDKYINAKDYIDGLDIESYPTSLFIDKNGTVRYAEGGIPYVFENGKRRMGDGKDFEDIIETLLQE